jgi:L-Ala-D/L-Glu epimerase
MRRQRGTGADIMTISLTRDRFPLARAFTISRGSKTEAEVLTVTIRRGGHVGRGECVPYARYGETPDSVAAAVLSLQAGIDRDALQTTLPPGAARNAVDCALWDLEAKTTGLRAWDLAGLAAPVPCQTAFTLSLDTPAAMHQRARDEAHRPILKIKLGTPDDLPRLRAVHAGAPQSALIVDANEGWSVQDLVDLLPVLADLGVALIEQPLPAGADDALRDLPRPIPVCADESCHTRADLPRLRGLYDAVNVKLDKTGGLTEALALVSEARSLGFRVMVGCMVGSSLAMAPATLLTAGAAWVDLDGPLLLSEDRARPLRFDADGIHPPARDLWG